MNEHLAEKFRRGRPARREAEANNVDEEVPSILNPKIREYVQQSSRPGVAGTWLHRPELPSSTEVLDVTTDGSASSEIVEIEPNKPEGAWASKEAYLSAQYELLREDAVRPLREAVQAIRSNPYANEDAFQGSYGIYDKVHICAITCSPRGLATKITFSLSRTGKSILWEQSKRLITGSLVVLSPREDAFKTKAIVATVAARPVSGLSLNPPELDLLISAEDQEIDPAQEFVMIEHRGSLYEASRHTLSALQKMMQEPFPFAEHLVSVQKHVDAPGYLEQRPRLDMTSVFQDEKSEAYESVDVLQSWPADPAIELDDSQLAALRRILTKRLALVQGPPGTGKTHVSVKAIKAMHDNLHDDDPPIIIACQTNHAVDQILRLIAHFEPNFIRLGGRSKDKEFIKPRTLWEVKKTLNMRLPPGCLARPTFKAMETLTKEIEGLLAPLRDNEKPLDPKALQQLGLLTAEQVSSLESGASRWVRGDSKDPTGSQSPFQVWLGKSLVVVPPKQMPEDSDFDFEEADLEVEQLKEAEAENGANDEDEFETLSGDPIPVADNFTCREASRLSEAKIKALLQQPKIWQTPVDARPGIYRYLQREQKKKLLEELRKKATQYNKLAADRRTGFWEKDENILKRAKIIGMTTSGLSKFRGLLAALEPRVVLIEEAGETLEAPVTAACLPSLQHLILVGDHKQLRPHCFFRDHEDAPFYLNISLFERLIRNGVEFDTLSRQRRMIPEIRRILHPIYGNLIIDHDSVKDRHLRPDVPGMGGVNSYWFTHDWPEERDSQMSSVNTSEADMIVGFVEYLVYNGVKCHNITVLTFYNGQRKKILSGLRQKVTLGGQLPKVATVDSYQGEENMIVILSLVRSNDRGQVGFLSIDNRVCVALSRAQNGFYIFGNAQLLFSISDSKDGVSDTWKQVILIMANQGANEADRLDDEPTCRLDSKLRLRCQNHSNLTEISESEDWDKIVGGCTTVDCNGQMPCGHTCDLKCHPFSHDDVGCPKKCGKELDCGHECQKSCGAICSCKICDKDPDTGFGKPHKPTLSSTSLGQESGTSSSDSWKEFAADEPIRYKAAVDAAKPSIIPTSAPAGVTSRPVTDSSNSSTIKALDGVVEDADEPLIDLTSEPVAAAEAMEKMSIQRNSKENTPVVHNRSNVQRSHQTKWGVVTLATLRETPGWRQPKNTPGEENDEMEMEEELMMMGADDEEWAMPLSLLD